MAYSARADIEATIGSEDLIQLTDVQRTGEVDDGRVTAAIAAADADIDGYCGSRYSVPFGTVPDQVKQWSITLAVYYLNYWKRSVTDEIQKQYDAIMKKLRDVAAGIFTLGSTAAPPTATETDAGIETTTDPEDRVFTRGNSTTAGSLDDF